MWLYHRLMSPNDADGMANSVDPDQTAPLGAVWSGSALFAQAYLSEDLGSLRYEFFFVLNAEIKLSFSSYVVNFTSFIKDKFLLADFPANYRDLFAFFAHCVCWQNMNFVKNKMMSDVWNSLNLTGIRWQNLRIKNWQVSTVCQYRRSGNCLQNLNLCWGHCTQLKQFNK